MKFSYQTASDAELLEHISNASAASVSVVKAYYTKKGDFNTVDRINACRKILKQRRMQVQLNSLYTENQTNGLNIEQPSSTVD